MWSFVFPAFASPEITQTELSWMVREIAPFVERAAGREFVTLPEVVAADTDLIAQVVYDEQLHMLINVEGMPLEQAQQSARRTSLQIAAAFAGKYGFLDQRLYISVEGIGDSLALEGGPEWLLRPLTRVVIAHELTHALQDQHTDLDDLVTQASTGDAIMAINCTVEGHAVWVHEQVGREMGLDEAVDLMTELLGYDQPFRRRMNPDEFYHTYVYGLGRAFVEYHAVVGGNDQVWQVLESPPDVTAAIVAPARWSLDASIVEHAQRRVVARAIRRLGSRGWRSEDSVMGDFDVRDQLVRAGADLRIADDLDAGWNTRLVGGAMSGVEVQLLRFKSPEGAVAYVDDMQRQAETQARLVGKDPFISADAGPFVRVRADRAAREAITLGIAGMGAADHLGRIWVAEGSDVVQVVLVNAPATDREVAATIGVVLRGLKAR